MGRLRRDYEYGQHDHQTSVRLVIVIVWLQEM
jgi:hypothetical protein